MYQEACILCSCNTCVHDRYVVEIYTNTDINIGICADMAKSVISVSLKSSLEIADINTPLNLIIITTIISK